MAEAPSLPDDVLELGRRLIPAPVFLVGCARSGTSIFGEALAAHARVVYLFEVSRIWNEAIGEREDHRLTAAEATPEVARAVYEALAEEVAASELRPGVEGIAGQTVLEKNPKHVLRIAFLDRLFPEARFLHIVRDGRDVTASLMFRNRDANWGHLEVPGWRDLLARYPTENWLRCAHQWRIAVETARREGRTLGEGRYLEIRYEDLIADPEATVGSALRFIGLDHDAGTRAFLPKIQDETAGSYHARKQVRHYIDDHRRRVGRFRENFTDAQLDGVTEVCGALLEELGYETD